VRKLQEKESRYVPLGEESADGFAGNGANSLHNGNGHFAAKNGNAETPIERLERSEAIARLRDAVLTLPEHYREPIALCDLEGKSYEEASALLGCPVGTVRSRLNRARSILLEKLRPSHAGARVLGARLGGKE